MTACVIFDLLYVYNTSSRKCPTARPIFMCERCPPGVDMILICHICNMEKGVYWSWLWFRLFGVIAKITQKNCILNRVSIIVIINLLINSNP